MNCEFTIIPIIGDGNCFSRAVSYCIFGDENEHFQLRLQTVNKVINDWSFYKDFIIGEFISKNEYEEKMKSYGQFGGQVELQAIIDLFPQYTFKVHIKSNNSIVIHGSGDIVHDLLFSENDGVGHYDVLKFCSLSASKNDDVENYSVFKSQYRKHKSTLTNRRETTYKKMAVRNVRSLQCNVELEKKTILKK